MTIDFLYVINIFQLNSHVNRTGQFTIPNCEGGLSNVGFYEEGMNVSCKRREYCKDILLKYIGVK